MTDSFGKYIAFLLMLFLTGSKEKNLKISLLEVLLIRRWIHTEIQLQNVKRIADLGSTTLGRNIQLKWSKF